METQRRGETVALLHPLETFLVEWKPGELVEAYNAIDALETFLVEWKHPQHVAARYTAMHLETFLVEWKRSSAVGAFRASFPP